MSVKLSAPYNSLLLPVFCPTAPVGSDAHTALQSLASTFLGGVDLNAPDASVEILEVANEVAVMVLDQRNDANPQFAAVLGREYLKASLQYEVPLWNQIIGIPSSFKYEISRYGGKPNMLAAVSGQGQGNEFYGAVAGQLIVYSIIDEVCRQKPTEPFVKQYQDYMGHIEGYTSAKYQISYLVFVAVNVLFGLLGAAGISKSASMFYILMTGWSVLSILFGVYTHVKAYAKRNDIGCNLDVMLTMVFFVWAGIIIIPDLLIALLV